MSSNVQWQTMYCSTLFKLRQTVGKNNLKRTTHTHTTMPAFYKIKLGYKILVGTVGASKLKAGLVAQSEMSATDTLGHWDVRGLSATNPRLRQWISIHAIPKDVRMPS